MGNIVSFGFVFVIFAAAVILRTRPGPMSQLAVSTASLVQPHPNVGQTCSCSCACECCCCPSNCNTTCFICPTLDALQWTMGWPDRLASSGIRSMAIRCLLAEMLGTFLLVAFGDGGEVLCQQEQCKQPNC